MKKSVTRSERRPPYTIKSAAKYLSLSTITIRRLIARRVLRSSKVTRKILIPADDVENLVESTC
jgi:excisionase family DNA binding protein